MLRRSARAEYQAAIAGASAASHRRWSELGADPNSAAAVAHRAVTLRNAWSTYTGTRIEFLTDRCRKKRVLDIGCVAHNAERMQTPSWLHGRVAAAASFCLGVDVDNEGIRRMEKAGFRVVSHDLSTGLGPLAELEKFDTIVGGELIEHLNSPSVLFDAASHLLKEDGELILTSPNPYAPRRVLAGQSGVAWENADHVLYAFPSGVAELAERHGLLLVECFTVEDRTKHPAQSLRARVKALPTRVVGIATLPALTPVPVREGIAAWLARRTPFHRAFLGETFIYVVKRQRTA